VWHYRPLRSNTSSLPCFEVLFTDLVRFLGWGISPSQGLYLHRTIQTQKRQKCINAPSGIQTHDPAVRAFNAVLAAVMSCTKQEQEILYHNTYIIGKYLD
jgi:hypothetical protein